MRRLSKKGGQWSAEAGEQEYWLSYSDLMAGLLMVFALMLLSALHHYQTKVVEVRDILEVRRQIIEELRRTLGTDGEASVEIDPATGLLRFKDEVLFDEGSAQLRPEGKAQLSKFAGQYLQVLLGNPKFREQLEEIVIEGHTNDIGSYIYNLRLSQERAYAVMEYLVANGGPYSDDLMMYVTANGRSKMRPILTSDNQVDRVRSRRIEIRFRLKDEAIVRSIMERLGAE